MSIVKEAMMFAMQAHEGQYRRISGLPYITHPISVFATVKKYKESKNIDAILCAELLHDTIEDCGVTTTQIEQKFGLLVASIVVELTNDDGKVKELGKQEYINDKIASISNYALVIKLADFLDNCSDNPTTKMLLRIQHHVDFLKKVRALTSTHKKIIVQIEDLFDEYKEKLVI